MCSETQTLFLLLLASWFMGFDYLFNERLRRVISVRVRKLVWRMERGVDSDIKQRINFIRERGPFIITAFIFIVFCTFIFVATLLLKEWLNVWVLILVMLVAMALMSSAIVELSVVVLGNILPALAYAIPSVIFKFVRNCPKGVVFGIGFVLLQLSFICRFYSLQ